MVHWTPKTGKYQIRKITVTCNNCNGTCLDGIQPCFWCYNTYENNGLQNGWVHQYQLLDGQMRVLATSDTDSDLIKLASELNSKIN